MDKEEEDDESLLLVIMLMIEYYQYRYVNKEPYHGRALSGNEYTLYLLNGQQRKLEER
jgi:hypothetical protein